MPSSIAAPQRKWRVADGFARIERWLDAERDQLPLWMPVMLGCGIAAWFELGSPMEWLAWLAAMGGLTLAGTLLPNGSRMRQAVILAALASAMGCGLAWWRAERVAAPVLTRNMVGTFDATLISADPQPARGRTRLTVAPNGNGALVRINVDDKDMPGRLRSGDRLTIRARLTPPPGPAVPGGYDFARAAWFERLGGVGKAIGPVIRTQAAPDNWGLQALRDMLSRHIRARVGGSAGGIAAAFASGDRGGIDPADEDSMRASGLTHLLSISGLHITAVVGAAILLTMRLLALSPRIALRISVPVVAAGMGALAGIGYTILTGAEVPTIRSCVAAVLVVIGVAMGRQAFTLRLLSVGALFILLLWPEALMGASFQLSFAAIASIVAFHEWPPVHRWLAARDEPWPRKIVRMAAELLATGTLVELTLAPIALFHFHRQGVYGAIANIVAIPLTTFVTMPMEGLALLFDLVGAGKPFWWLTDMSLRLLLWISHSIEHWPGSLRVLPDYPVGALALTVMGGFWAMLWHQRVRMLGWVAVTAGVVWAFAMPPPDIVVTRDGKHLLVRGTDGTLGILRPRAGDFVRDALGERGGSLDPLDDIDDVPGAQCSDDLCRVTIKRGGRDWRILATRTSYRLPWEAFTAECAAADIVISDRRLPRGCQPKWFRADESFLRRTGAIAVTLATPEVTSANSEGDQHPWVIAASSAGRHRAYRTTRGNQ